MKGSLFLSLSLLLVSAGGFAGGNSSYSCEPIPELNSSDYNFHVVPIKKGDTIEIGSVEKLNLSLYQGKIVLLSVFSENCWWCAVDLYYHTAFQRDFWPKDNVVMVNLSFGNERPADDSYLDSSPKKMLDYITEGYKTNKFDMPSMDLADMDFYHFLDSTEKDSAFSELVSFSAKRSPHILFPGLTGTPYSVIIDREGGFSFADILQTERNLLRPNTAVTMLLSLLWWRDPVPFPLL